MDAICTKYPLSNALGYALYQNSEVAIGRLKGKLLTLCDSSFTDPTQRKAFKDLLSQMMEDFKYSEIDGVTRELIEEVEVIVGDRISTTSGSVVSPHRYITNLNIQGYKYTREEV